MRLMRRELDVLSKINGFVPSLLSHVGQLRFETPDRTAVLPQVCHVLTLLAFVSDCASG